DRELGDGDVAPSDTAEGGGASHKSSRPWSKARGAGTQKPNSWKLARLLRTCDERPRSRRAEKWHELAPSHQPPGVQERSWYPLKLEQWKRPNLPVKPQSWMSALGQKQTFRLLLDI